MDVAAAGVGLMQTLNILTALIPGCQQHKLCERYSGSLVIERDGGLIFYTWFSFWASILGGAVVCFSTFSFILGFDFWEVRWLIFYVWFHFWGVQISVSVASVGRIK